MAFVRLSIVHCIVITYLSVRRSIMLYVTFANYQFNLPCYIICKLRYELPFFYRNYYFILSEPDKQGHEYGPNSPEVRDAVSKIDYTIYRNKCISN